ncbi:hypothetical protein MVG78_09605 [Roseomonas gilardii subsp. gilardii]|uniref:hypothetical protein n=1 Tax=Roseomonas gilardii TaxID=257708 RepID=UPI001FF976DF|nr:hypothetical protein [Roseomonas gilardii]UPG70899.1 hypothetical protein MVG78_09605 [Roseomonas gilardii subsp. gilardii]
MRRLGLSDGTWRPLLYLGRMGGGIRQTDLAGALGIEGASLVRLLDALERGACCAGIPIRKTGVPRSCN